MSRLVSASADDLQHGVVWNRRGGSVMDPRLGWYDGDRWHNDPSGYLAVNTLQADHGVAGP